MSSNSKQSLQTLSLWLIHHRKRRIKPPGLVIASVWEQELRKGSITRLGFANSKGICK
uniref:Uncharacterized protein n=1 Tax=Phasianus colchicus TaxID=9054 RepID=A0A669QU15_PHACC